MNLFETAETIGIIIASLLLGISKYREIRRHKKGKNKPSDFLQNAKIDGKIYAELHSIRNRFRAKRIYIMQFKNGGYYFSGESIKSMNMTHEVWDYPLQEIKNSYQNIPLDFEVNPYLESLTRYNLYRVDNVSELKTCQFKDELIFRKVGSLYMFLLVNGKTKDAMGFLTITFSIPNGLNSIQIAGVKSSINIIRDLLIEK